MRETGIVLIDFQRAGRPGVDSERLIERHALGMRVRVKVIGGFEVPFESQVELRQRSAVTGERINSPTLRVKMVWIDRDAALILFRQFGYVDLAARIVDSRCDRVPPGWNARGIARKPARLQWPHED